MIPPVLQIVIFPIYFIFLQDVSCFMQTPVIPPHSPHKHACRHPGFIPIHKNKIPLKLCRNPQFSQREVLFFPSLKICLFSDDADSAALSFEAQGIYGQDFFKKQNFCISFWLVSLRCSQHVFQAIPHDNNWRYQLFK